jgi:two-component system sensor histidine kinase DegS
MTSEMGNAHEDTLESLISEAQAAVSSSANTLRGIRERYRTVYGQHVDAWERLRTQAAASGAGTPVRRRSKRARAATASPGPDAGNGAGTAEAADALAKEDLVAGRGVSVERSALSRIDLAVRSLENAWLFLGPGDETLVLDPASPTNAADAQMRIVEAQEAERSRLAREVHDGPAQALANAIFQLEIVERLLDRDEALARAELQLLRDMLTRELRAVRAYLSQLRPPVLADLGLSGAIKEAAEQVGAVAGASVSVDLDASIDGLPESVEIVILRVIQEALQNVRKHAAATSVRVRVARDDRAWLVEVRDDGRGFIPEAVQLGGRRSFGLQFMRERAELIGARFEVRSRPDLGTAVRMTVPWGGTEERT